MSKKTNKLIILASAIALSLSACTAENSALNTEANQAQEDNTPKEGKDTTDNDTDPKQGKDNIDDTKDVSSDKKLVTNPNQAEFVDEFVSALLANDKSKVNELSIPEMEDRLFNLDQNYSDSESLKNFGQVVWYTSYEGETKVLDKDQCSVPAQDECGVEIYDTGDSLNLTSLSDTFNGKNYNGIKTEFGLSFSDQTIDDTPGLAYESNTYWLFGLVDGEYKFIGIDGFG